MAQKKAIKPLYISYKMSWFQPLQEDLHILNMNFFLYHPTWQTLCIASICSTIDNFLYLYNYEATKDFCNFASYPCVLT